ncbi:hypothetical protein ACIPWI_19670 [Streptomyces sp. NPDC090046]|uniref:hypothetical protein n=1 Tax=Streptomyces sp. NPDC090046 TaxID=3365928 RepID=UPI0038230501
MSQHQVEGTPKLIEMDLQGFVHVLMLSIRGRRTEASLPGLFSKAERKSCRQLAEQAGHARPGPTQRRQRHSYGDADAVRGRRHARPGLPDRRCRRRDTDAFHHRD